MPEHKENIDVNYAAFLNQHPKIWQTPLVIIDVILAHFEALGEDRERYRTWNARHDVVKAR